MREFTLSDTQENASAFSLNTWEAVPAIERTSGGEDEGALVFWMDPGQKMLLVSKPGFVAQSVIIDVPDDGRSVWWRPVLVAIEEK